MGRLQKIVATAPTEEVIAANCLCGRCGEPLPKKGSASIVYRTAFGKLHLNSPRYYSTCICDHSGHEGASFNPLAASLTERSHPEFDYLQTQGIRGMRHSQPDDAATLMKKVASAKWWLWHGRAQGAIERLREISKITTSKRQKQVKDMIGYLGSDQSRLINYGARYRAGLPTSTSLAESAVNFVIGDRFKKKDKYAGLLLARMLCCIFA